MTLDAAEKAGVPVAWLYPFGGKMAVTMDRQVACDAFPGVASPVPLVPASELDTARAEIERLREAVSAFKPHGQVAFLWQTKGARPGEVERYRDAYAALLATLSPAVKEPM